MWQSGLLQGIYLPSLQARGFESRHGVLKNLLIDLCIVLNAFTVNQT